MDIMITKQKPSHLRIRTSKGSIVSATKDGSYVIDRQASQVCFIGEDKSGEYEYQVDIPAKYVLEIARLINKEV